MWSNLIRQVAEPDPEPSASSANDGGATGQDQVPQHPFANDDPYNGGAITNPGDYYAPPPPSDIYDVQYEEHDNNAAANAGGVGTGMFMGRLTRFLENVTAAPDDEDNGWDEAEEEDFTEDYEDDDNALQDEMGWNDASQQSSLPPQPPEQHAGLMGADTSLGLEDHQDDEQTDEVQDGWGDDDDHVHDIDLSERELHDWKSHHDAPIALDLSGPPPLPPPLPASHRMASEDTLPSGSAQRQGTSFDSDEEQHVSDNVQNNAWNDDDEDDLDFSNHVASSEQQQHLVLEQQARQSLDHVLQSIQQQEQRIGMETAVSSVDSDMAQDEQHAHQAVQEIQDELQAMQQQPVAPPTLAPPESSRLVVDQVPRNMAASRAAMAPRSNDPSLQVLAELEDLTRDSHVMLEDDIFQDENESEFGPVVDVTPQIRQRQVGNRIAPSPSAFSRQDSLAVQAHHLTADMAEDDAMAASDATSSAASDNGWSETLSQPDVDGQELTTTTTTAPADPDMPPLEPAVVDYTPSDVEDDRQRRSGRHRSSFRRSPVHGGASLEPIPSEGTTTVEEILEDGENGLGNGGNDPMQTFGPVVDHTPPTPAVVPPPTHSATNSTAVQASTLQQDIEEDDAMDETYYGGGSTMNGGNSVDAGWDQDEAVLDSMLPADDDVDATDGAEDDYDDDAASFDTPQSRPYSSPHYLRPAPPKKQPHVVDLTPSELSDPSSSAIVRDMDASMAVLAQDEDRTRDTGDGQDDVFDDENEMEYRPVVDHLPKTPMSSGERQGSLIVQGALLEEDIEDDDAMDETVNENSTLGDATGDGQAWEGDQTTPGPAISETVNADGQKTSTGVALVDHLPSEMGKPRVKASNLSVSVLGSEGDTKEADDASEHVHFGPVVDNMPVAPGPAQLVTRTDSIITQPAGDGDDTTFAGASTIDAGGTSTIGGGGSTVNGDGDDGDDRESDDGMPSALRSLEDQLVDRVPFRPELRYGDASTLVAADPSEVLSEVDDMIQESNYGPVVDVTPPAQPLVIQQQSSGAGSTVVFAPPSIGEDELEEDADETNVGEEEPNPQSGNDDPPSELVVEEEEQVVDFLPPQESEASVNADATSRADEDSSAIAVGGALSLLPTEELKEDDFGPVVDQTPFSELAISNASTATQLTASECRALEKEDNANADPSATGIDDEKGNVVVDHLPSQMRRKGQMDSIATMGRSQMSEDEEEDQSQFGPVVDHLPTSRASLAPSRGGSTVDALATVSEVGSDDGEENDASGWEEDDVDLDASDGGASDKGSKTSSHAIKAIRRSLSSGNEPDRNVSVRFDTNVVDTRSGDQRTATAGACTSGPEVAGTNSARVSDKLFAEADTPPSTPYRRWGARDVPEDLSKAPLMLHLNGTSNSCSECRESDNKICPCVEQALKEHEMRSVNGGKDGAQALEAMLQSERLKLQLIEAECERLRYLERSHRETSEQAQHEIERLRRSNGQLRSLADNAESLANELLSVAKERDILQESLVESKEAVVELQKHIDEHGMEHDALQSKRDLELAALKVDKKKMQERLSEVEKDLIQASQDASAASSEIEQLSAKVESTIQELHSKSVQCDHIDEQRDVLERQCGSLTRQLELANTTIQSKTSEVASAGLKNSELEKQLAALRRQVSALQDAAETLKDRAKVSEQAANEEKAAASKARAKLTDTEQTMLKFASDKEAAIRSYEMKIEDMRVSSNELVSTNATLTTRLDRARQELAIANSRVDDLEAQLINLANDHQSELQARHQHAATATERSRAKFEQEMKNLSTRSEQLQSQLNDLQGIQNSYERLVGEMEGLRGERDALSLENEEMLVQFGLLQQQMDMQLDNTHAETVAELDELQKRFESLQGDCSELRNVVSQRDAELARLGERCRAAEVANGRTELDLKQARAAQVELERCSHEIASHGEAKLLALTSEIESKEKEVAGLKLAVSDLEAEIRDARSYFVVREGDIKRLQAESTAAVDRADTNGAGKEPRAHEGKTLDVESLRAHVVSLAVALQRSETRRAEAIDRLLQEREGNADSLRRLSDSVKRYYATVSFGDAS